MNIIFRSDASHTIGTGHIVRCLILADKMRSLGNKCIFAIQSITTPLREEILKKEHEIISLSPSIDMAIDASSLLSELKKSNTAPDIIILDHYGLQIEYERMIKNLFKKIVVIDDLERGHDCDLVIDPNYRTPRNEGGGLTSTQRKLSGAEYCILREDFHTSRYFPKKIDFLNPNILCFFGGSDYTGESLKYINAIRKNMRTLKKIKFNFLISRSNKYLDEIVNADIPPNVNLCIQPENIANLINTNDLYIGSGGIFTWERMCLGLTGIVISVAENQHAIGQALHANNYQVYLGRSRDISPEIAIEMCISLLDDKISLLEMSEKSSSLIDGLGSSRVTKEILTLKL